MTLRFPESAGFKNPVRAMRGSMSMGIVRTDFESGISRSRSRNTVQRKIYDISYLFTDFELQVFYGFLQVAKGNWFEWRFCAPFQPDSFERTHVVRITSDITEVPGPITSRGRTTQIGVQIEFSATQSVAYTEPTGPAAQPGNIT